MVLKIYIYIRKISLNILKKEIPNTKKISKNIKRFKAGIDEKLLEKNY